MKRKAVYAGTFDILTNGHLWMIQSASRMFDELVIAIGENPNKKCLFSLSERLDIIWASIRNMADYEYEKSMLNVNRDMNKGVETVFLIPPKALSDVSSSMIKGLIGPDRWDYVVKPLVPAPVFKKLKEVNKAILVK